MKRIFKKGKKDSPLSCGNQGKHIYTAREPQRAFSILSFNKYYWVPTVCPWVAIWTRCLLTESCVFIVEKARDRLSYHKKWWKYSESDMFNEDNDLGDVGRAAGLQPGEVGQGRWRKGACEKEPGKVWEEPPLWQRTLQVWRDKGGPCSTACESEGVGCTRWSLSTSLRNLDFVLRETGNHWRFFFNWRKLHNACFLHISF